MQFFGNMQTTAFNRVKGAEYSTVQLMYNGQVFGPEMNQYMSLYYTMNTCVFIGHIIRQYDSKNKLLISFSVDREPFSSFDIQILENNL